MKVNFFKAQLLLWKRIFDYKGKSSQREYWFPVILQVIFGILVAFNLLLSIICIKWGVAQTIFLILAFLFGIYPVIAIIPGISLTVRRLRDAGKSGWWTILLLIVGIGTLFVMFLCASGSAVGGVAYRGSFNPFYNEVPSVYGPPEWYNSYDPYNNTNDDVYGPPSDEFDIYDPYENEEPAVYGPPEWFDD